MKNIFLYVMLSLYFLSCSKQQIRLSNNLILKKELAEIVDSFLYYNPQRTCYELFVNKVTPHESNLIFYAGDKSLIDGENKFKDQYPIMHLKYNGEIFDIYSGIERYIGVNQDLKLNKDSLERTKFHEKDVNSISWLVVDSFGIYTITKDVKYYPFFPLPQNYYIKNFKPIIEEEYP